MAGSGDSGRSLLLLVVLLGIAVGVGGWNYKRNLDLENQIPRPWKGYAASDLEAMAAAYEKEIDQYSNTWDAARGQRNEASGRGHVDDRAREFDEIYAQGRQVRQIKSRMADHEVVLAQLRDELRLREGESDVWKLHLRRLTAFN
jgi:hypothetical protein